MSTEGREQREAVAAFKRATAFLTNPISGLLGVVQLPDPLDALSPDLSVVTFQPLSVLSADSTPVDAPSSETNEGNRRRSRSAVEVTEPASRNSTADVSSSAPPRGAYPVFPVARRREGEQASLDGEAARSRPAGSPLAGQNGSANRQVTPSTQRANGSQGQPATLTARDLLSRPRDVANPDSTRLTDAAAANRTQPDALLSAQMLAQPNAASLATENVGIASTAAGQGEAFQRTIDYIGELVDGILAQPGANSAGAARNTALITTRGNEGKVGALASAPPAGNSSGATNVVLPPLASLARPPANLPDVPSSSRAPYPIAPVDPLDVDAEALSDMINQVLVEQARRYGVDFS